MDPSRDEQLGRSLFKRLGDVLAYFDVGVSNGPVEAINGRLEHLRGIAYQAIIDCYQMGNKREAKKKMRTIIDQLRVLKGAE